MPTLEFKGKHHIYAHHLTVPHRPLHVDESRSVLPDNDGEPIALTDQNLIIHGDNLHALKALLPHYGGRVKCIYIDPPYNTGNEGWVYNDNVNSPMMKKWLEENSPVDSDDLERHDKWLCMMWPRLHLLRELLADDGAIFISIDDNEVHHLRMLMDEVFGEENLVANVIWRKKAGGGQDSGYYAREHEYVVCYRKTDSFALRYRTVERTERDFPQQKNGRYCRFMKLEKWGANAYREDRPTMYYAITDPDGKDFFPRAPDGREGNWRKRPTSLDDNHIHWQKRKGRWTPYEVQYLDELRSNQRILKERTIHYDLATTTDATRELQNIFGSKVFDTTKPVELVLRQVLLSTHPDSIVLDSFAGSGTTAHAVLALNKQDGGNRRFILVECEDYADTITAERVRRVIKGVPSARDKQLREGLGGSFAYCTLGDPIDANSLLKGDTLPSFADLAAYLLYTATGISAAPQDIATDRDDGFFYASGERDYYLIYEPDTEFLRSHDAALNLDRAIEIESKQRPAVVFAAAKYMGQRELTDMQITFCQLPYE